MTPKQPIRTIIPRWAVALGIASGLLLLLVCGGLGVAVWALRDFDPLPSTVVESLTPEQVERAAAITLPPSARNMSSHYESFQDYIMHVRFEIDPADLTVFLASTHVEQPLSTDTIPSSIESAFDQPWWQPAAAERFVAGEGSIPPASDSPTYQAIFVDTTNAEAYVVYVVAFDT